MVSGTETLTDTVEHPDGTGRTKCTDVGFIIMPSLGMNMYIDVMESVKQITSDMLLVNFISLGGTEEQFTVSIGGDNGNVCVGRTTSTKNLVSIVASTAIAYVPNL